MGEPITTNPAARLAELAAGREDLSVCGLVYSWEFFHAMAARLAPGTHMDILRRDDGAIALYHHRPRQPGNL